MNVKAIREDFPILKDGKYVYFDNAATTQRPVQVLEAVERFYKTANANPLRGLYKWAVDATDAYENARERTARFIGAADPSQIIFTRNATEAINLVAYSYALSHLKSDDEIVVSVMEHHSNLLPWQMAAKKTGAKLVFLEPDERGRFPENEFEKINERTAIVAIGYVSNVLGVTNPVEKIISLAHKNNAVVLLDGAQAVPHKNVDVTKLDTDFLAFSGHKMLSPFGIGVLYGKKELLEQMDPFLTGGEMIEYVTRTDATYAQLPHKFEAGTVNAAGAVGLAAAMDYIDGIGWDDIGAQELKIAELLYEQMKDMEHITVYGPDDPKDHCGIITFNVEGCHPHDVASVLDSDGICIRAGHHCAQPLMQYMSVNATVRASVYFYNTLEEAERFIKSLSAVRGYLGYND